MGVEGIPSALIACHSPIADCGSLTDQTRQFTCLAPVSAKDHVNAVVDYQIETNRQQQ